MAIKIQIRRDSSTNWATTNPVLSQGELGLELDTGFMKAGNGTDNWNDLPYLFEFTEDLIPLTDNTYDLGSWTKAYKNGFFKGNIVANGLHDLYCNKRTNKSGSTQANSQAWVNFAKIRITATYQSGFIYFKMIDNGISTGTNLYFVEGIFSVKQQAPLNDTDNAIERFVILRSNIITNTDIKAKCTQKDTNATEYELWIRLTGTYNSYTIFTESASGSVSFSFNPNETVAYQTSAPVNDGFKLVDFSYLTMTHSG